MRRGITIAYAARLTGLHPSVLQRLIERGDLPARRVSTDRGEVYLVDRKALMAMTAGEFLGDEPADTGRNDVSLSSTGPDFSAQPSPPPAAAIQATPVPGAIQCMSAGEVSLPAYAAPHPAPLIQSQGYQSAYMQQPFVVDSPGGTVGGRVMLSLEWAGAIKEYSHNLISPLVELLREKDARLEEKERIIQSQTEALARARQEVEQQQAEVEHLRAEVTKLRSEGDAHLAEQQKEMRILRTQLKQAEATLRMMQSQPALSSGYHESRRRWWWPFGE
ncbi:MAG: hypothetical protein HY331_17470 [Chloroflexi bacterium]|nr:hypothetical protein [Chloroflexota bacterium]